MDPLLLIIFSRCSHHTHNEMPNIKDYFLNNCIFVSFPKPNMSEKHITVVFIEKDKLGTFNRTEKRVVLKDDSIICPDGTLFTPYQEAKCDLFFDSGADLKLKSLEGLEIGSLVIFQDPNFVPKNASDISCYPLPLPLNYQLYHEPLVFATSNTDSTKILSCTRKLLNSIWKKWVVDSALSIATLHNGVPYNDEETPSFSIPDSIKSYDMFSNCDIDIDENDDLEHDSKSESSNGYSMEKSTDDEADENDDLDSFSDGYTDDGKDDLQAEDDDGDNSDDEML